MLKRIATMAGALLVSAMMLVACGGSANAAPLPFNFTASDGVFFSIDNATSVEKTTNGIAVTKKAVNSDGVTVLVTKGYADAGGAVWNGKVLPLINSTGLFIRVGTSDRYIGAQAADYGYCYGSGGILFYIAGATEVNETISGGCPIVQAIKALGNQ